MIRRPARRYIRESVDNYISIFSPDSDEFEMLAQFRDEINDELAAYGAWVEIEDIYYDYGQDWMWTTLVAHTLDSESWQALNPRDQENVLEGRNISSVIDNIVNFVMKHNATSVSIARKKKFR